MFVTVLSGSNIMHRLCILTLLVCCIHAQICPEQCQCSKTLQTVNCQGKQLTSIPEGIPPMVEKLYLDHNFLTDIKAYAFVNLTFLQYLNLRTNKLTVIKTDAFSGLPQLQNLYLRENNIVTIERGAFGNSSSLINLYLDSNKLRKIPNLFGLTKLEELILQANQISEVIFPPETKEMNNLNSINLSSNKISIISVKSFENLKKSKVRRFKISRNNIVQIENGSFAYFSYIQSLKLSYNPLTADTLSIALQDLKNTKLLSLDISHLNFGDFFPSKTFHLFQNTTLKTLILSNNKLGTIPNNAFISIPSLLSLELNSCEISTINEGAFNNLKLLHLLNLKKNLLVQIPSKIPKCLQKLYLDNNKIQSISNDALGELLDLRILFLEFNSIHLLEEKAFSKLVKLQKLHLGYNAIAVLPGQLFGNLVSLNSLKLNNNKIQRIQNMPYLFASLVMLLYLNLNSNGCVFLPLGILNRLQKLQYLYLANNNLGSMFDTDSEGKLLASLRNLMELDISNNRITQLSNNAFRDLSRLHSLNLQRNFISGWKQKTFSGVESSLASLDLSQNMISLLNESSFTHLRHVKTLNLSENPFACTCDLRWFRNFVKKTTIQFPQLNNSYVCNSPESWQNKMFVNFDESKIDCTDYTLYYIIAGVVATLVVTVVISAALYRKRWFIKLHVFRLMKHQQKKQHGNYEAVPGNNKKFDAFISYDKADVNWVLHNLLELFDNGQLDRKVFTGPFKLCFDKRDFEVGKYIVENMLECIEASRTFLVVLSESYFSNDRCCFELMQAFNCTKTLCMLDEIIVIKLGKLEPKHIPKVLHAKMKQGDFIEWDKEKAARQQFMEKLNEKLNENK